jgi:membrane associated rhomboid family serine protease
MNEINHSEKDSRGNLEKRRFYISLAFPVLFLVILWLIKLIEYSLDLNFAYWGIYPLRMKGLKGILFSPLIHSSFKHLINNTVPLLILGVTIFYFYYKVAFRVFFLLYLMVGVWVWFGGRPAYHIGASGLVYGFASFIFFSGIIRNHINLMAISLLVVFLYGGMIWGIFPIYEKISWESHMLGSIAGLFLAFYYRHEGPQRPSFFWEEEEEEEEEVENTSLN